METRIKLTEEQIHQTMLGYVGIQSIREGWWWELHQFLTHEAFTTFVTNEKMADLRERSTRSWDDAEAQDKISAAIPGMAAHLQIIWDEMCERKEKVRIKYLTKKENENEKSNDYLQ